MMVVSKRDNRYWDSLFARFPEMLRNDDVLVLNDTRVFPARLFGRTETGAQIEVFLTGELGEGRWEALARPAKRLKVNRSIIFNAELSATVEEVLSSGKIRLRFTGARDLFELLESVGSTPLPPYIKRASLDEDRIRYQTVYARNRGAIAAPTAGLHFTDETLDAIKSFGVQVVMITLHVGYGTFEPIRVDNISEHDVLPENVNMSESAAEILNQAKKTGRRIIAVGTTTTRALEWNIGKFGRFTPVGDNASADLTIRPGYQFRAIDGLLTNFHLPESSLLVLVSAFAGHELIMKAYEHAVSERYRFYSYGDCMFIS
jgi:S-adenosylmethionine:tRNA ribosyltransferase-isomerase